MGRRKNHHTVTRALLAGFAQNGGVMTRLRQGREFPQSIRKATVVADFYSFDNEGSPDDAVEGWLAGVVESDFTALLSGLREEVQPTKEMRPAIARFVAVAVTRTRTARWYMDQIDQHLPGFVVLMTVAPELGWRLAEMSPAEIEHLRALCQQAWESLPPREDRDASLLRVVVRESRRIEGDLKKYVWSVATTDEPSFLIGDAPVLALSGREFGWRGLIPKGAAVFLPLSPQAVLVGEQHVFGRSFAAGGLAEVVNALTVREAYEAVYRHPHMAWPSGIVLGSAPYRLPEPSFSMSRPDPLRPPTFPYRYPQMDDAETAALLKHLKAVEVVE